MKSRDLAPEFVHSFNLGYIEGIKQGEKVERERIIELLKMEINRQGIDSWKTIIELIQDEDECNCKNCLNTDIEARGVCSDCYANGCDQEDGACD